MPYSTPSFFLVSLSVMPAAVLEAGLLLKTQPPVETVNVLLTLTAVVKIQHAISAHVYRTINP